MPRHGINEKRKARIPRTRLIMPRICGVDDDGG
jgi:hypothetical protein